MDRTARTTFVTLLSAIVLVATPAGAAPTEGKGGGKGKPKPPPAADTVTFSGMTWHVKSSSGRVGPGPNYFSNSTENVWVDEDGNLHLRISKRKGKWYAAEVISDATVGYGTYRWTLASPVDDIDPSVVLGMFTWDNTDPSFAYREIDVEFARWSDGSDLTNAQYVVQPYDEPGNMVRFTQPPVAGSVHSFERGPDRVVFTSTTGSGAPIHSWTWTGAAPPPGNENARMNLWLFQGRAPTDGRSVEVVIESFEFIPA